MTMDTCILGFNTKPTMLEGMHPVFWYSIRNFTTTPYNFIRGGARTKPPISESSASSGSTNQKDSDEYQFVQQIKNPQRKSDEEVIAEVDFGYIRLDRLNKPVAKSNNELSSSTWTQETSVIPTESKPDNVMENIFDVQYELTPQTSHSKETMKITDDQSYDAESANFIDEQYFSPSSNKISNEPWSDHTNIETEQPFREGNLQAEKKPVSTEYQRHIQEADESANLFDEFYFTRGSSEQSEPSSPLNTLIDKIDKEKKSPLMKTQSKAIKKSRQIDRLKADESANLFDEFYFTRGSSEQSEPSSPLNTLIDKIDKEKKSPLMKTQSKAIKKSRQIDRLKADESANLFDEFYFTRGSSEQSEPSSPLNTLIDKIDKEKKSPLMKTQSKAIKKSRQIDRLKENADEDLPTPWSAHDDYRSHRKEDERGSRQSDVVSSAERNTLVLERGLYADAGNQSGLYPESDQSHLSSTSGPQTPPSTQSTKTASPENAVDFSESTEMPLESLQKLHVDHMLAIRRRKASTGNSADVTGNFTALGQHPAVGRKLERETPVAEGVSHESDSQPMTAYELRMRKQKEWLKGKSSKQEVNRAENLERLSDRLKSAEGSDVEVNLSQIKVDSKGFRILKDQVADVTSMTRDELAYHIIKTSVLYEDDDLVAISKPYGLPSIEGPGHHISVECLRSRLAQRLKNCDCLHIVHRLDKETTGVMLLAKTRSMASTLSNMFKEKQIVKQYLTITTGVPDPEQGIIDIPLVPREVAGRTRMWLAPDTTEYREQLREVGRRPRKEDNQKAISAVTNYRVISSASQTALVLCQPETGVKHQIRCHLGYGLNTPILGDHKYSYFQEIKPQRLHPETLQKLHVRQAKVRHVPMHLCAKQLIIPNYRDGKNLFVSANLPVFFRKSVRWLGLVFKR